MDDKDWEEAFVAYGLDAAVGRRFRGLIHNLNGVAQAFSMQTELLGMFFSRAREILQQLGEAPTLEEARELGRKLAEFLRGRAALVVYLEKEVGIMQEIMLRSSSLMEGRADRNGIDSRSLNAIIESELEFMNGDSFFKHRVRKELQMEENLPVFSRYYPEIHQIIGALLENCAQALAERGTPDSATVPAVMQISCIAAAGEVVLQVTDNGPGIAEADPERIFAPFYTTWPGHLGLGLYLARKMAERCGGTLVCQATPGRTLFTLRLPVEEAEIG
jgi:signal transduction histidine kinase